MLRPIGRNPSFYKFLRTLQAYEKLLDENTTVFLPADAEVLRVLRAAASRSSDRAAGDGEEQVDSTRTCGVARSAQQTRRWLCAREHIGAGRRRRATMNRAARRSGQHGAARPCVSPRLRRSFGASRLLARAARCRHGGGLFVHGLLRSQCRRARGGAPFRRDRRARRSRHSLPPAVAGRSRRCREDHQRDEDRRRLRAAREGRATP